jgi:hypothetical protein
MSRLLIPTSIVPVEDVDAVDVVGDEAALDVEEVSSLLLLD